MAVSIRTSIAQGFRSANKSWAGIGCFAGTWVLVIGTIIVGVLLTRPPAEVFEEEPTLTTEVPVPPLSKTPSTDLFSQLNSPEDTAPVPANPPEAAAQANAEAAARQAEIERRDRLFNEWTGRVWPMLLVAFLGLQAAGIWLTGGQIGYLVKQMRGESVRVSELWRGGARAFGPLLGSYVLFGLGFGMFILLSGLPFIVLVALVRLLPAGVDVLQAVLGVVGGVAFAVGLIWGLVRLAFWGIAIVADRQGPVSGLKRAWAVSRGHWWKIAGLLSLTALIGWAVWIPVRVLEWVAGRTGSGLAISLVVLVASLAGLIASLYVGFASVAALIRCYEDAKAPAAGNTG